MVYWRDWSESQLAAYQGDQGSSNHCAKFAAASALNLLYGREINGNELVSWVGSRPLKGTGVYTILGNHNGSLVYQTANLLRALARLEGISLQIKCGIGDKTTLLMLLDQSASLALVSLTYFRGKEPLIARGEKTTSALGSTRWVGGHIMILAAYDPDHHNRAGISTPWGFLSSWGADDQLYWMTENDFLHSWGRLSIFNMVSVSRSDP